jgi:hypothetical protein
MHQGGEEMHTHFQWEKLAGSDNLDDLSNDGKILKYRVIKNDCRGFNNLSYTIHLR